MHSYNTSMVRYCAACAIYELQRPAGLDSGSSAPVSDFLLGIKILAFCNFD